MSQGQWEQHQPVKSSPSTQIKRLFIHLYLLRAFGIRARVISHRVCERPSN